MRIKTRIDLQNRTALETVIPIRVPFIINVDPSDKCNLLCKFCPTGDHNLMRSTPGRNHGPMSFELFKKIVNDICGFESPIKVLRMYKEGEPLSNPHFADMVRYAKQSGCSERIDTTTNAVLLTKEKGLEIISAGLDRINISIYGMALEQYKEFSGRAVDFERLVGNVQHFFENSRGKCEVIVKVNGDVISKEDEARFYTTFGEIADGVSVEHIMSCWPEFDLETHGVQANREFGIYGQAIKEVRVCPYIFYSFSVNSDGTVSACFIDWERKLLVGDANTESIVDIWNGASLREHQAMMLRGERKTHPTCGNCGQMTHGLPDDIDHHREMLLQRLE